MTLQIEALLITALEASFTIVMFFITEATGAKDSNPHSQDDELSTATGLVKIMSLFI